MHERTRRFAKHLVQPVPPRDTVPVRLFVGDVERRMEVARPRRVDELTCVSREGCSKRTRDLGGFGPRMLARRAVTDFAPHVRTGYFLDTRFVEPNNISHLLMDIIPMCLCVKKVVDDPTFVFRPLQGRFRELLSHFGIEPLCTYRPVSGIHLSFRLARGLAQFEIHDTDEAPLYSYTGEVYPEPACRSAGTRIFISRRGVRAPLNAAELNAFLEARGFSVLYLEDHPIAEQIAIMQQAEDVAAIHGAALAYLALKDRTRTVVELLPPNVYHDHFPIGIGHKVDNFIQVMPCLDEQVQFQGWPAIFACKQQPFAVDLNQLARALDAAG